MSARRIKPEDRIVTIRVRASDAGCLPVILTKAKTDFEQLLKLPSITLEPDSVHNLNACIGQINACLRAIETGTQKWFMNR